MKPLSTLFALTLPLLTCGCGDPFDCASTQVHEKVLSFYRQPAAFISNFQLSMPFMSSLNKLIAVENARAQLARLKADPSMAGDHAAAIRDAEDRMLSLPPRCVGQFQRTNFNGGYMGPGPGRMRPGASAECSADTVAEVDRLDQVIERRKQLLGQQRNAEAAVRAAGDYTGPSLAQLLASAKMSLSQIAVAERDKATSAYVCTADLEVTITGNAQFQSGRAASQIAFTVQPDKADKSQPIVKVVVQ